MVDTPLFKTQPRCDLGMSLADSVGSYFDAVT